MIRFATLPELHLHCYDSMCDFVQKVSGCLRLKLWNSSMDMEETVAALLSENEQLGQENDHLKTMLSLVKENRDLRARMQSFNSDSLEEFTGIIGDFVCH